MTNSAVIMNAEMPAEGWCRLARQYIMLTPSYDRAVFRNVTVCGISPPQAMDCLESLLILMYV